MEWVGFISCFFLLPMFLWNSLPTGDKDSSKRPGMFFFLYELPLLLLLSIGQYIAYEESYEDA